MLQIPGLLAILFQRTGLSRDGDKDVAKPDDAEQPLTCMIYFFASQMRRNIQTPLPHEIQSRTAPAHRLDTMLAKVGMHAAYSPLISRFETFPVEIPEAPGLSKKAPKVSRDQMHDTMLLMKFRSKRAREEWIATREWQEFMQKTEQEGVFRRIPHVRCARSLKGLMDPIDVLTA